MKELSIHRLLAEPDTDSAAEYRSAALSIHRLLAEPDKFCCGFSISKKLSIHRLLAEPDVLSSLWVISVIVFQSTGSLRSPTSSDMLIRSSGKTFNPQAPCGARQSLFSDRGPLCDFQSTGSLRSPTSVMVA